MRPKGILIYYHCQSNTGYAIGRHEPDFLKMAEVLTGSLTNVHVAYTTLKGGMPSYVPSGFNNVIEFDPADSNTAVLQRIYDYISIHEIDVAFGFDQPVSCPAHKMLRKAGVKLLVSYWGAPMSSLNGGLKLALKRFEVKLRRHKPDHYIFQSKAMADSAVLGRGVDPKDVTVIPNAVDTTVFSPDPSFAAYAYDVFGIPNNRKIIFYSGHMEERKGVHIIVKAAMKLVTDRKRDDMHFVFLGNKDGEEQRLQNMYCGTPVEEFITFGGYRDDINMIHKSCYLGVIATTGWDSFTMSSMEMASSGLPLIVSKLQGLKETIIEGVTGFLIEPGDFSELAEKIESLVDNPVLRDEMALAARSRVVDRYSLDKHIQHLISLMKRLYGSHAGGNDVY